MLYEKSATKANTWVPSKYSSVLSDMYGSSSRPDDQSGGLDRVVEAAHAARQAYDELDYLTDKTPVGAVRDLLRRSRETAYDAWQMIERSGLPLLQRWQRETLGYSESEISR